MPFAALPHVTLWHNPNCSKSRAAKALLEDRGLPHKTFLYLDEPVSEGLLRDVLAMLDVDAHALVRSGEPEFAEHGLDADSDVSKLIDAMLASPILIQRPILVAEGRAVIGRPTEATIAFLDELIASAPQ